MENYFIIKEAPVKKEVVVEEDDFLIQRDKPNFLNEFQINSNEALKLSQIVNHSYYENNPDQKIEKNIINLFIYGQNGVGKMTLARGYINEYLGYPDLNLQSETVKYDSKELEYFRGRNHIELIIYKYNFNDLNLISGFFKKVCLESSSNFTGRKNIIIIKNVELIRPSNMYLLKNNIEKYSLGNVFILISNKFLPPSLRGYFCNLRVPKPSDKSLIKLGNKILKKSSILAKNIKKENLKDIVKQVQGDINKFKNLLEHSYLTGKYQAYEDCDQGKFIFLYKMLKQKNFKNLFLIRETLTDMVTENIPTQTLLKFLMNKIIKSPHIEKEKKPQMIRVLVECDINDKLSLRNVIHLENAFVQLINIW